MVCEFLCGSKNVAFLAKKKNYCGNKGSIIVDDEMNGSIKNWHFYTSFVERQSMSINQ